MHCPGHNTGRDSQLASEGWYFRMVKNNVPYLEGQLVGGGGLEIRCLMFRHNTGLIFFNICGWAFIRGSFFFVGGGGEFA